jgi:hypothetical protein
MLQMAQQESMTFLEFTENEFLSVLKGVFQ